MDVGRRDFFIAASAGFKDEVDPSWYEAWKANVAYHNMPIIESVQEHQLFGKVERDPNYDVVSDIGEQYLPYYEDLIRAKNAEHLQFLKERVDLSLHRRITIQRGHWSAALVGGITDPLFLTTFVPGLNAIGLGKTVLSATGRASALGFGYGIASEARRAPFAVADSQYHSADPYD